MLHNDSWFSFDTCISLLNKSCTKLKKTTVETMGFIRTNKIWSLQTLAYASTVLYIIVDTYNTLSEQDKPSEYAVARSCGAALKLVLVPSILLPISRVLTTKMAHTSIIKTMLTSNHHVTEHKAIAATLGIASFIHTGAHYLYGSFDGHTQSVISGTMMLGSFAIPLAGVYFSKNYLHIKEQSYGKQVMRPHQLGTLVFLAAYSVHTTDFRLVPYTIIIGGAYLTNLYLEYKYYTHRVKIKKLEIMPDGEMLKLYVKKPVNWLSEGSGQYGRILVPNCIDKFLEYPHPFTIVNDHHDQIEFLIKNSGPWTKRLFQFASSKEQDKEVIISGPFGNSLSHFHDHRPFTMIGMGVGMTPCLSYLNDLINHREQGPAVSMHISQRNFSQFTPCFPVLEQAYHYKINIKKVHFYVTGNVPDHELAKQIKMINKEKNNLKFFILTNKTKKNKSRSTTTLVKNSHLTFTGFVPIQVIKGRPHFPNIIKNTKQVTICGNPAATKEVDHLAKQYGIKCHKESF